MVVKAKVKIPNCFFLINFYLEKKVYANYLQIPLSLHIEHFN